MHTEDTIDITGKQAIIIDDHKLFTNGLSSILKSMQLEVKMTFENGKDALNYLKDREVDIVFSDINMPEMDGIQLCKRIKQNKINTKIIMLSMYEDPNIIKEAFDAGADGYLSKNTEKEEILNAVQTCLEDKKYLSSHLKEKRKRKLNEDDFTVKYNLTTRERDVLKLLLKETNNKDISKILNISLRTVETHRSKIYLKLGVKSPLGLGKVAVTYNLFNTIS